MRCMLIAASVAACALTEVAGFSAGGMTQLAPHAPRAGLRGAKRRLICMADDDRVNTKKVAG